jgi:DNA-binding transcriptional LysR family regulator
MTLSQRELRAFLAIHETGSLGRAATTCNMTQPGLSRLVQVIEERLGQALFDRHTRGMRPTSAGDLLAPYARAVLFEMNEAMEALGELQGLRRGTVRIGAVATVTRAILPDAAKALLDQSPGIRIRLLEAPDDQLAQALVARDVDLIVTAEIPANHDIDMVGECRFDDVYTVFSSVDHPLAHEERPSLDAILAQSWIMPGPGATPRRQFEAAIRQAKRDLPEIAVETGSPEAITAFVAKTHLLGWLPRPLIARALAAGDVRLLEVDGLSQKRRFFVYRRRQGSLSAAARRMIQALPMLD